MEGEKKHKESKKREKLVFIKILCFNFTHSITFNYYDLFVKSP